MWGPKETGEKMEVYFAKSYANVEMEPDLMTYSITVTRVATAEAASIPIVVTKDVDKVFGVPDKIEFPAGAKTTNIDIDLSKMELEKKYELEISIPAEYYYLYKKGSENGAIAFHLVCLKQKWNEVGTCTFTDYTWFEEPVTVENVKIQNHEGTMDYRMIAPYHAVDATLSPVNFLFKFDPAQMPGKQLTIKNGQHNIYPETGYIMYFDPANYGAYCYIKQFNADGEEFVKDSGKNPNDFNTFVFSTLLLKAGTTSLYGGGAFIFTWNGMPESTWTP